MKYLAELVFIHFDLLLTPLLTNNFSLDHKSLYYIYMLVKSMFIVKNYILEQLV